MILLSCSKEEGKRWWIMVVFTYWENGSLDQRINFMISLSFPVFWWFWVKWWYFFWAFPDSMIAIYACGGQVDFC